jgi:hypothetical protein
MRIGITIGLTKGLSIFSNGITQNLLTFYDVMNQLEGVDKVSLVDLYQRDFEEYQNFTYLDGYDMEQWDSDIQNRFDVLIVFGITPTGKHIDQFKSVKNNKVIAYKCGNTALLQMENVIFDRSYKDKINEKENKAPILEPIKFDEIWSIPQQEFHNLQIWEVQHNTKARVVPFLWSNKFIEQSIALNRIKDPELKIFFEERVDEIDQWRVATMEPNQNVQKNMYPLIWLFEYANRLNSGLFDKFKITNAMEFSKNDYLIRLVKNLSFHKQGRLLLAPRWKVINLMARHADAIISHQWGNPLNYAYFDVVYLGYPLIHNAHLCADLGYYYADWNVKDGAKLLVGACATRKNDTEYTTRHRSILKRYTVENKEMLNQYELLLKNLWDKNDIDNKKYDWKTNLLR